MDLNKAGQRTRRNVIGAAGVFGAAIVAAMFGRPRIAAAGDCFLRGTRIWTPEGETRVEDLRPNDRVVTFSGEAKPIKFVARHRWTGRVPIRVARSALGPNNPHRDLYLSDWHSLYLDGVLVPVFNLLNDETIVRCKAERAELEFFHILLARHDIIFAEGAACETYLGGGLASCDNFAEYRELYGDPAELTYCAPVLCYDSARAMLKGRLRSAVSPIIDFRSRLDVLRDDLVERI